RVLGYEALIRGPEGSAVEGALSLLHVAIRSDLQWEFDRACLRAALAGAAGLKSDARLFVNVLPPTFFENDFAGRELPQLISEAGLTPQRVVLELTEQITVTDLDRFRDALAPVRARGFGIA